MDFPEADQSSLPVFWTFEMSNGFVEGGKSFLQISLRIVGAGGSQVEKDFGAQLARAEGEGFGGESFRFGKISFGAGDGGEKVESVGFFLIEAEKGVPLRVFKIALIKVRRGKLAVDFGCSGFALADDFAPFGPFA